MNLKKNAAPALFGIFDGATSGIAVILTLASHPHQIIAAILGLAVAGGIGMGAGSWLSRDDDGNNERELRAAIIGIATAVGTVIPMVPFLFSSGTPAVVFSIVVMAVLGAAITVTKMKTDNISLVRAALETYVVLFLVCVAVTVCTVVSGASG